MARYKKGIMGPISGTCGTVVGASWRGIDYLRSLYTPSDKPRSAGQLDQQYKFTLANRWLHPLKKIINIGFQHIKERKTPINEAASILMKTAIAGSSPEFVIDFSKVIISNGFLCPSVVIAMDGLENNVLEIKWVNASYSSFNKSKDVATFVVFDPVECNFEWFERVANRDESEIQLQLPLYFTGKELHCWMFYENSELDMVSTSIYAGAALLS
ncbi:hypothetical protein ACVWYN_002901 [Pedobacter sp. UYP24]